MCRELEKKCWKCFVDTTKEYIHSFKLCLRGMHAFIKSTRECIISAMENLEKQKIIGFALCFEKKLCDINNVVSNLDFNFRTFGHFDGFSVKEIYKVSDFSNLRKNYAKFAFKRATVYQNSDDNGHKLYHLEKQMLNCLLYEGDSSCIFDESKSKEAPIVVVTIVNKYDKCVDVSEIQSIKSNLSHLIDKFDEENKLSFEVFQTLSIEDYVIVFRANNLSCIADCLMGFRSLDSFDAINVYSIVSLDCRGANETLPAKRDDIIATLKLYVKPEANFEELVKCILSIIKSEGLLIDIIKTANVICGTTQNPYLAYASFGRFDVQLTFSAFSLSHLLKLYDKVNTYMKNGNRAEEIITYPLGYIISTETTILSPKLSNDGNIYETVPADAIKSGSHHDESMPLDNCLLEFRSELKEAIIKQDNAGNKPFLYKIGKKLFVNSLIDAHVPTEEYQRALLRNFFGK